MTKILQRTIRLADIKKIKFEIGLSCLYERDLTYWIPVTVPYF